MNSMDNYPSYPRYPPRAEALIDALIIKFFARVTNDGGLAVMADVQTLVRGLRRRATMSQRELAAAAGLPVSRIEAGQSDPRWSTIVRLVEAADCQLLLAGDKGDIPAPDLFEDVRDDGERHWPAHLHARLPGWWSLMDRRISKHRDSPRLSYRRRRSSADGERSGSDADDNDGDDHDAQGGDLEPAPHDADRAIG